MAATIYFLLLFFTTVFLFNLSLYAWWQRHKIASGEAFFLVIFGASYIVFMQAAILFSPDAQIAYLLLRLQYLGQIIGLVNLLVFVLIFTQRQAWLSRSKLLGLYLLPSLNFLVILTNPYHGWFYKSYHFLTINGYSFLEYEYGWWYYLSVSISLLYCLPSFYFLSKQAISVQGFLRIQSNLISLAFLIPMLSPYFMILAHDWGLMIYNLMPLAYLLMGIILRYAIYRYGLMNVEPIAHDKVFQEISIGLIIVDNKNSIIEMNQAAQAIKSETSRDYLGKQLTDIFPELSSISSKEVSIQQGAEKRCYRYTKEIISRDQEALAYLILLHNIDKEKQEEEVLRYQASILANVGDAIIVTDSEFKIQQWNAAAERIYGWTAVEVLGKSIRQVLNNPNVSEEAWLIAQERLMRVGIFHYEILQTRKDGRSITISGSVSVNRNSDGLVMGFISIERDVTEAKRQEMELRYQAKLLANVSDAVIVTDLEYRIQRWNASAEKIYGWKEAEVLGKKVPDLLQTEYNSEENQELAAAQLFKSGFFFNEVQQKTKDGRLITILGSISVFKNEEGRITGIIAVNRDITQRKATEIALRENESRFRGLFEQTNDSVFIVSLDRICLAVNQRGADMLGYTINEILGKPIDQYITLQERSAALNVAENLNKGMLTVPFERNLQRKDGSELTVEVSMTVVKDAMGKPQHVQGVLRDITERKKIEQILIESEERYRSLFEQTTDAVFLISLDLQYLDANQRAADMLGYQVAELIGLPVSATIAPAQLQDSHEIAQRLKNGEEIKPYERILQRKDGTEFYVEMSVSLVLDSTGKALRIQSIVRDIMERKAAEIALRESESRFRGLFDQSYDAVFIVSLEKIHLALNQRAADMLGYTVDELLGTPTSLTIAPHQYAESNKTLERLRNGEKLTPYERILRRKDGTEFPVEVSLTLVLDSKGKAQHIQSIIRDISERKKIEQALMESEERYRSLFEQSNDPVFLLDLSGKFVDANSRAAALLGVRIEELFGMVVNTAIIKKAYPEVGLLLERIIAGDEIAPFERVFRRMDGSLFPAEINIKRVHDRRGKPLYIQAIVHDISAEKETEKVRQEQQDLLEVLLDIMGVLNSTLEFDRVIELILNNVGRIVPHDAASITLVAGANAQIIQAISHGHALPDEIVGELFLIEETKTLRTMFETQLPLVVSDVKNFPEWVYKEGLTWVRSFLGMPIVVEKEVIGFLNLYSAEANFYKESQNERLQLFSSKIALAIKNANAHEQGQALAAANERQRLARELHDAVSQTLFSATIIAETLPQLFERDVPSVQVGLRELVVLTKGALSEMRLLLLELRPSALLETPFAILLQNLQNSLQARIDAEIEFELSLFADKLSDNLKINLYRIIQEAVNNIVKHSRARYILLSLESDNEQLELKIADDGIGFDINTLKAHQLGLRIMRERASEIGFQIAIESGIDQGTEIRLYGRMV